MSSVYVNTTTGFVRSRRRTRKQLGWSTPERRAHLVSLFNRSKGFCVFGHRMCQNAEHHFLNFQEAIIADWKAQDRAEREALLKIERAQIHGEKGVFGRQFDPVERDVFMANRPDYYLKGLGVSPVTFKKVAKVRVPSTYVHLYVDLSGTKEAGSLSKNKRRKMQRYGQEAPAEVNQLCRQAVEHWWAR